MDTDAQQNTESDQVIVKKVDVVILLINIVIPVAVILVAGWVMVDKSYWAGLGFFAMGIVFWFLIFYIYKIFFRESK